MLLPGLAHHSIERIHQNTALVVLVDGPLPRSLNKHFRLRSSNRVSWRNIQRLAPEANLNDYKASHARFDDEAFESLLGKLLSCDYALLAERVNGDGADAFALTHMHVKVERLTDNAIKDLGKELGYIERRLFERGEDYVEALESKFFEYHGFSATASGRKSAAAMAAQLLKSHNLQFCVYVASQEDGRLTLLDHSDTITQYMLIRPNGAALDALVEAARTLEQDDLEAYTAIPGTDEHPVVLFRLTLTRTPAAQPIGQSPRDMDQPEPWLQIAAETVLPRPGSAAPEIPFAWSTFSDI